MMVLFWAKILKILKNVAKMQHSFSNNLHYPPNTFSADLNLLKTEI